jgi:hypothetical protein
MDDWWQIAGQKLYLRLLHANFLGETDAERATFSTMLMDATTGIPSRELRHWLQGGSWREMLVAGWVVGLRQETSLRDLARERLLASSTCYAGQGLCVAVARFADERAAQDLTAYLEQYLPVGDRQYDQEWAIGSLAWLDLVQPNSRRAERFLQKHLWTLTVGNRTVGAMDPERGIVLIKRAMEFADAALALSNREHGARS